MQIQNINLKFFKMQENYRGHVFQLPQCLHNVSYMTLLVRINVAPCVEEDTAI